MFIKYVINPVRESPMFMILLSPWVYWGSESLSHSYVTRKWQSCELHPSSDWPSTTVHHLAGEAWGRPQLSRIGAVCLEWTNSIRFANRGSLGNIWMVGGTLVTEMPKRSDISRLQIEAASNGDGIEHLTLLWPAPPCPWRAQGRLLMRCRRLEEPDLLQCSPDGLSSTLALLCVD